jgi:hypothetical protein
MSTLSKTPILLTLALVLGACDRESESEVTEVASFCVETQSSEGSDRLVVSVTLDECLSSSCDMVKESECTVSATDDALVLEARALINHKRGSCTADCGSPMASCSFVPDAEGEYTLRAGDLSLVYAFPGDDPACVGAL